jgi:CobQ-like glutamine amidotransferase family enzyme
MTDLSVVVLYPELLGLYADRGNGLALRHRARKREIGVELIEVAVGDHIPESADIYLLGGAEDAALLAAGDLIERSGGLKRAVARGAVCMGVCAGFQLMSEVFAGPDTLPRAGLGLLDVRCGRLTGERAVGEVVSTAADPALPMLGFENHQGDAVLGADARPLAQVWVGVGNGHSAQEGAVQGNVIGTYLHGPVLVRNPHFADELIERAMGSPLAPVADEAVDRLRKERYEDAAGPAVRREIAALSGAGSGRIIG